MMKQGNRGIIKFIILVILAIAALAYFQIDLRTWAEKIANWWEAQDLAWFKDQFMSLIDRFK